MFVFLWQRCCLPQKLYAIMDLVGGRKRRTAAGECKKAGRARAAEGGRMKDYQKVMLLLYPKLERMATDIGQIVRAKAAASYTGREPAEAVVEKLIEYNYVQGCVAGLKEALDGILRSLDREEAFLLEYKYFRRKKELSGTFADMRFECSERTYFRRQLRLERKLNALFMRDGLTEAWFFETFSRIPYIMAALESVRGGRACGMVDKRVRSGLCCRPPKAGGGGGQSNCS